MNLHSLLSSEIFQVLAFICTINNVCARMFEQDYYPRYYNNQQNEQIEAALGKLEHGDPLSAPKWVPNWPDQDVEIGQVSGLALNVEGHLLVFHRGSNVWDGNTFNLKNVYRFIGDPPVSQNTVLVFNDTGDLVDSWGKDLFYIPHGITVDKDGNVWLTDVALHQVFKFTQQERQKPALVLGEKFIPGSDVNHFCKPSAVAVLSTGDFFVADGYCNSRIIKYAADGTRLTEWGSGPLVNSPYSFNIPHALTLAEDRGLVCVANREKGCISCFRSDNGTFVNSFRSWLIGGRMFSVAYTPVHGGRLYLVNGPGSRVPVRGYVIDFDSGRLTHTFAPDSEFLNPHDVVASPDGSRVYVADLTLTAPCKVCKFVDESLANESSRVIVPVKPTATIESWSGGGGGGGGGLAAAAWRGWAAGGAGALGAALLLASAALCAARRRGRKSSSRRWEYGHSQFKLRRFLERRRFTRVQSDDSEDEPAPMLPNQNQATA